jgi:hypothetical protein
MNNNMYVVVSTSKRLAPLNDLMEVINSLFPNDTFTIVGSEDKGYQFRVLGSGDEKAPRKIAETFLKKWKPTPEQVIEEELAAKKAALIAKMQLDDEEYFAKKESVIPQINKPRRGRPPKNKVYETLSGPIIVD